MEARTICSSLPLFPQRSSTLLNAGVREPDEEADDGKLSLCELAVSLYVSLVYDGDDKGKIDRAMTAIILQIKDYGGGEESA